MDTVTTISFPNFSALDCATSLTNLSATKEYLICVKRQTFTKVGTCAFLMKLLTYWSRRIAEKTPNLYLHRWKPPPSFLHTVWTSTHWVISALMVCNDERKRWEGSETGVNVCRGCGVALSWSTGLWVARDEHVITEHTSYWFAGCVRWLVKTIENDASVQKPESPVSFVYHSKFTGDAQIHRVCQLLRHTLFKDMFERNYNMVVTFHGRF